MAIEFSAREFLLPFSILRMRRNLMRTQWLDERGLRDYQDERLRSAIRHAAEHVPYYRQMFSELRLRADDIGRADDLRKLPRLERETVRANGDAFHSDDWLRYRPRVARTSGTSGLP